MHLVRVKLTVFNPFNLLVIVFEGDLPLKLTLPRSHLLNHGQFRAAMHLIVVPL